jgi:hypothetical protein
MPIPRLAKSCRQNCRKPPRQPPGVRAAAPGGSMGEGIRPAAHSTPGTRLRPWRLAGPSPARQFSDLATHAKLPVRPGEQFLGASKPVAKQKLTENGDAPAQGWKKRRSAAGARRTAATSPAARAETIPLTYKSGTDSHVRRRCQCQKNPRGHGRHHRPPAPRNPRPAENPGRGRTAHHERRDDRGRRSRICSGSMRLTDRIP